MNSKDWAYFGKFLEESSDSALKLKLLDLLGGLAGDYPEVAYLKSRKILVESETFSDDQFVDRHFSIDKNECLANGFAAMGIVRSLLFFKKINFAKRVMQNLLLRHLVDSNDMRVKIIEGYIEKIEEIDSVIEKTLEREVGFKRVSLNEIVVGDDKAIEKSHLQLNDQTSPGVYKISHENKFQNDFNAYFKWASDKTLKKLKQKKFDARVGKRYVDRVFVLEGAQVSTALYGLQTVFDKNGRYHESFSSRLSKIYRENVYTPACKEWKEAYVLPFPHSSGNYYHVLAEMVYGLRYVSLCNLSVPIIYDSDKFNLLPYVSECLGLDFNRFFKASSCQDVLIDKAYVVSSPQFHWNQEVHEFFKGFFVKPANEPAKKIYISRKKSSRCFENEDEVCQFLSQAGFEIICAEDFSFKEQVTIFGSAETVISPHGAGLANLAFCPSGLNLIELFHDSFIEPAFYFRSLPILSSYKCLFVENNVLSIADLQKLL
ncbi:glycosyltransferase family 61 protein [Salinicola halophyticus]|uniref:glycosyltransferase family 61 protein n=1 Tax=Salinicola halophyticus TaxID=1808881 RepID=UPI000DA12F1E|nr:glycosyltransferase family 61 protein [Salinicola halophyticus]